MDSKKLLKELDPFQGGSGAQRAMDEIQKLQSSAGFDAKEKLLQSLHLSVSGALPGSYTSMVEQEAAKAALLGTAGIGDLTAGGLDTVEGLTRSYAEKALGFSALDLPKDPRDFGAVDWEEMDRAAKEREQLERMNQSLDYNQQFIREAAEARQREDAKIEYMRRSAEASEGALAEERRKREAAEIATHEAKVERAIAEKRADRAEKREELMVRLAILGLFSGVVGILFAAWPFI